MISSGDDVNTSQQQASGFLGNMFSSMFSGRQQQNSNPQDEMMAQQNDYEYTPEDEYDEGEQNGQNGSYGHQANGAHSNGVAGEDDPEKEIPLLEDLDIDLEMVKSNLKAVILFKQFRHEFTEDPDMTGPLIVGFSLALSLMLSAKITFGYIYGLITCGGVFLYCIINLVNKSKYFMLYATISVLGYCLFPMVILSLLSAVINLGGYFGVGIGVLFASWSSYTAIRFLDSAISLQDQKYLIAYPIFLFYITFVMIIIF